MATINIKTLDGLLEIFGGYQSIIDALGYVPANKDGVLSNEYFGDLNGDDFVISDKSGNVILRVDKNGLETTKLKANIIEGDLTGNVTGDLTGTVNGTLIGNVIGDLNGNVTGDVTGNLTGDLVQAGTIITDNIQDSGSDFTIIDSDGNRILIVDANGLETTNVKAQFEGDLTGNVTGNLNGNVNGTLTGNVIGDVIGNVTGNLNGNVTGNLTGDLVQAGTIITDNIQDSGSDFTIIDSDGNRILIVDANGLETTNVKAQFEGDLTGNVTGNLTGNADTATFALTADTANKVANKLSIITGPANGESSIEFDGSSNKSVTITPSSLGLAQAMLYIGTSTTEVTDGGTQQPTIGGSNKTPVAGNVVIYNNNEFIWNGSAWEKLGDEMNHKVLQTPVSDPTANGKTTAFIDSITQDANGNIVVTKKTVDTGVINADLISVNTLNATNISASDITTGTITTDNIINSGDGYFIVDNSGNIIASINASGISTTNVNAKNNIVASSVTADTLAGILNWSYIVGTPAIAGPNGSAISAGKHTHTATVVDKVSSTFNGNNNNTDTENDHVHTVTASGTVSSSFTGNAHSHAFRSAGTISEDVATGSVSSSFTGTAHSHTVTDNGHIHTISGIITDGSLTGSYSNGIVTLGLAFTTGNKNSDSSNTSISVNNTTATGSVSSSFTGNAHKHTFTGSASTVTDDASVSGSVSSTFTGNSSTTNAAGGHSHSVTPTGSITNTYTTKTVTTSENGEHSHVVVNETI